MPRAAEATCREIMQLISPWREGELGDELQDVFEQHLMFCPPCMTQKDKVQAGLSALPGLLR